LDTFSYDLGDAYIQLSSWFEMWLRGLSQDERKQWPFVKDEYNASLNDFPEMMAQVFRLAAEKAPSREES
jgi:hypothetical protein